MQISTGTKDFLVDTLRLHSHIGPYLREVFMDPAKRKVMHCADKDTVWLQRDFGIYICNLFDTHQDLLVAGTDTTTYGLERTMTELMHNPEVMSKAKKELEETIGKGKLVEESDVARLPYLQAVIKESLRLHPPAPFLLPRRAKVDVEVCGYTIQQGTQVLINEWAIGRNQDIWENAHMFSPERFLGSDIDVKGRNFKLTPFGSGRRICPGSPLVIRMLHLMLGSMINSFDWKLENDMCPKDMDLDRSLRAIPLIMSN
ncbi:hypothetical protein RJT34_14672 [Clitoria ternatea]|uniref:Cytochrome P450 n=1 Tax=Clitoria ternatea TaxID=43366 RepID=A0AAN9JRC3_CLITE